MNVTIFDIKDRLLELKKMVSEKKIKVELIIKAKKQLYKDIDLIKSNYLASIKKVYRKVEDNEKDTRAMVQGLPDVLRSAQKQVEYQAKQAANEAAQFSGKPPAYTADHMNRLQQEITELEKRSASVMAKTAQIERIPLQKERLKWLEKSLDDIRPLLGAIAKSTRRDRLSMGFYKICQAASFVLSVYGVFQLVEWLKPHLPLHEFLLNLMAGIVVVLVIDRITNSIKENIFQHYLEGSLRGFDEIIAPLTNVHETLASYNS